MRELLELSTMVEVGGVHITTSAAPTADMDNVLFTSCSQ